MADVPQWRFPFQRPVIPKPQDWEGYLEESYRQHWFSNHGPAARKLENELGNYLCRSTLCASSGTTALTLALMKLPKPGPVLLPAFTFPATFSAVVAAGCTPILTDVDPDKWEMSPADLTDACARLTEPPVAILAVRTFGFCSDLSPVEDFAASLAVPLIIDAAAAFGGTLPDGRLAGTQGVCECFSFHATKVFAVGEGGLLSGEPEWIECARTLANFGLSSGQSWDMPGANGKLSEFSAAIGLAQFTRLSKVLAKRRAFAARYQQFFSGHAPEWSLPPEDIGAPPWQAFPLLAPSGQRRAAAEAALARLGVQTRRYYQPALHCATPGQKAAHGATLPVAQSLSERMLCFPVYSEYSAGELDDLFLLLGQAQY